MTQMWGCRPRGPLWLLDNFTAGQWSQYVIRVFGAFISKDEKGKPVDEIAHDTVANYIKTKLNYNQVKIRGVKVTGVYLNVVMERLGKT